MKIINKWIDRKSKLEVIAEYQDVDNFDNIPYEKCNQVICFAFYQNRLLLVHDMHKNRWGLVGGGVERPESFEETAKRELKEEANVELLYSQPIGFQKVFTKLNPPQYQLRFFCQVKPYGKFESDPDGDIDAIKYIDIKDYKRYFDWGKIGEHLINRVSNLSSK